MMMKKAQTKLNRLSLHQSAYKEVLQSAVSKSTAQHRCKWHLTLSREDISKIFASLFHSG
jgi:hypothetical protein